MVREILNPPLAPLLQKPLAVVRSPNPLAARVVRNGGYFNKTAAPAAGDAPAHGGRLHLLCCRKFPKRFRSGKNQNRKSRELRRSNTGGFVLLAHAAQQMDRRGMKLIGNRN